MDFCCAAQRDRLLLVTSATPTAALAVLLTPGASLQITEGFFIVWTGEHVRYTTDSAPVGFPRLGEFLDPRRLFVGPFSTDYSYRVDGDEAGYRWYARKGTPVIVLDSRGRQLPPSETWESPTSYATEDEAHYEAWRHVTGESVDDDRVLLRALRDRRLPDSENTIEYLLEYLVPYAHWAEGVVPDEAAVSVQPTPSAPPRAPAAATRSFELVPTIEELVDKMIGEFDERVGNASLPDAILPGERPRRIESARMSHPERPHWSFGFFAASRTSFVWFWRVRQRLGASTPIILLPEHGNEFATAVGFLPVKSLSDVSYYPQQLDWCRVTAELRGSFLAFVSQDVETLETLANTAIDAEDAE